eukprot:7782359-Pyramimonas_sp.AAC.1
MGPRSALLRPFLGPVGPSGGVLGGLSGSFAGCEPPSVAYANNVRFSKGTGRFLLVGALLEGLLRLFWWGFSVAYRAIWRPSWASWNDPSATRGSWT